MITQLYSTEALLLIISTILFAFLAAFFTSAETALLSSDKVLLKKMKKQGSLNATLALKQLENIDKLLMTTQFGANISIAAATTLATILSKRTLMIQNEFWIFLLFTPFILIFSDSLPKVLARHYADKFSLISSPPLTIFSKIFSPAIRALSFYTNRLSRWVGLGQQDALSRRKKTREELHALLSDTDHESEIRLGHKRIIRKILEFSQQTVKKVMLPLVNVDAIEKNATIQDAIALFETLRHSRIPVYEERIDNIVGILHFPDIFSCNNPEELVSKYMRPALFVPEYQQLESLTKEMKSQNIAMAVVVDEYGGAVGIVTKEDILEEIVGNISDEFDDDTLTFFEISPNIFLVNVGIEIDDLNERLKINLPKGEYETLAGFLLQQFNRIPSIGDELFFSHIRFRVHRANAKSIETVIMHLLKDEKNHE